MNLLLNDNFKPRDYQIVSIKKMQEHFTKEDKGILVLPTGGGKTYTASKFIYDMFDSNQWKQETTLVIWLAHTIELIEQTKQSFEQRFNDANIAVISSQSHHSTWEKLNKEKAYNRKKIVFASYQSCSKTTKRKGKHKKDYSLDELKKFVKKSKAENIFIVIDEAHRATARTYRNILSGIQSLKEPNNSLLKIQLLGLTATPIRMSQLEEEMLHFLFDSNKIHELSMKELEEQGVLSHLIPKTIQTELTESELFDDKINELLPRLQQYNTLNSKMLLQIGESSKRNQVIVDEYVNHKETYGPTLVFATSIQHTETLMQTFRNAGIKSSRVYSGMLKSEITDAIAEFKAEKIEILINVNMLTEGVDIPNAKTAFLTRPTNSEALLRQMIGRVLRGPESAGTETSYAVDFVDSWNKFSPITGGYLFEGDLHELESNKGGNKQKYDPIPIEIALDVARVVNQERILSSSSFLPKNYYSWGKEIDGELYNGNLISYENWDFAVQIAIKEIKNSKKLVLTSQYLSEKLMDCEGPIPRSERDYKNVLELLTAIQNEEDYQIYSLDEMTQWSPSKILQKFQWKNPREYGEKLDQIYAESEYLKKQYNDCNMFFEKVMHEYNSSNKPLEIKKNYKTWKIQDNSYSIDETFKRVQYSNSSNTNFQLTENTLRRLKCRYSNAPELPSTWGFCQEEPYLDQKINIVISPRLNAPDCPLLFLEFILYHELIHAHIGNFHNHDKVFTDLEKAFVPSSIAINNAKHKFPNIYEESKKKSFYEIGKSLQYSFGK